MAPSKKQQQRRFCAIPALLLLALAAALPAAVHAARPWLPPPPPPPPAKPKAPPPSSAYHHHHNSNTRKGEHASNGFRFTPIPTGCNTTNKNIPRSSDKVNVWADTCAASANKECQEGTKSCSLYKLVVDRAHGTNNTSIYSSGNNYRSKIVPVKAMAGIESIVTDGEPTWSFWSKALEDAKTGGIIDHVPQTDHAIAYANSLDAREQHQLHIHIGEANKTTNYFFKCAHETFIDNPPSEGSWRHLDSNKGACANLILNTSYNVTMAATTAPAAGIDSAIRYGFQNKEVPGAKSGDIASDPVLLRTGVLVAPTAKSGHYLVVLIYNTDDAHIYDTQ